MKKNPSFLSRIGSYISSHKIISTLIIIVIVGAGVLIYRSSKAVAAPQYALGIARIGSIAETVSGSGQVSASNQTDIQSTVSGTVKSINVSVGQAVHAGDLIATIDPTNAQSTLENARLSYQKIVQPAKQTDVTSAQSSITKSYDDAFNSASSVYLDLPSIVTNLKDMFYGTSGFLSDQRAISLSATARTYRDNAGKEYDAAVAQYTKSLQEFQSVTRSSATSSIDAMLADTYNTVRAFAQALADTQSTVSFIASSQTDYHPNDAPTANSNVTSWSNEVNGDLSGLSSARNAIINATNSFTNLVAGPDSLDLESARLSLAQAQKTYDSYFIRAPYDGIIGRIPVSVYGQAGGSTAIATIIGNQKVANISLNEVDAAKVKVGQPVAITFDAIDGLQATGTVSQVDLVGTVSQGVVSYAVKILINTQDDRIKPGMSVNTVITTERKDNVLVVPSSAVKTANGRSYVQVIDNPNASTTGQTAATGAGRTRFASTTRQFDQGQYGGTNASSTATTTPGFGGGRTRTASSSFTGFAGASGGANALTTSVTPRQVFVTTGLSDDTNIEITGGLNPGQFIVTRTISGATTQTTAAPSILSSIGGNRPGAATGAVRTTGAAGGAANRTFGR